jgi:hypothetical protein
LDNNVKLYFNFQESDQIFSFLEFNIICIFQRYDESELPTTEDDLKLWLIDIWKRKEKRLANFTATSSFLSSPQVSLDKIVIDEPIHNALYLALIFWTLVQVISYYI